MSLVMSIVTYFVDNPGIIFSVGLLILFISAVSLLFSVPKPGENPFKTDERRPPKELEFDQAVRDKVLKQGFHPSKVPENLDAVVVGSGIGGLGVAVMLAKAGKKVLVLEQHDQAGGCCHTFVDKGFEFDVGIHYIGEMRNNTVSRLLVEQITEGQLRWVDLIEEFDVVAIGDPGKQKFYPFVAGGREKFRAAMLNKFPKEGKAIDKFLFYLAEVRKNTLGMVALKTKSRWLGRLLINTGLIHKMTDWFKYSKKTVQQVMDEITDNDDLKAVLSYSFGDYGTIPTQSSFAMHANLINHYLYGGSYPRGGASEIGFHTIPIIERTGGRVLVRAPVNKIIMENGKAVGVTVQKSSGDVEIRAPLVISDAGLINTFQNLLPRQIAEKSSLRKFMKLRNLESGVGGISLFVGLKGTAEELGIKPQNVWAFTGNKLDEITTDYLNLPREDVPQNNVPLLFISFPSAKDPTYSVRFPGKTVCTVVTLGKWEWFKDWENEKLNKRGADYDSLKMGMARRMWEQVVAIYPQLEDKVEYFDIGSPVTNKYYIAAPKGEIYGLDHTTARFGDPEVVMNLRPETDIPGLLLTGQDVFSCGFMGALFGGLLCASKVLNRNIFGDLMTLKKKVGKSK